MELLQKIYYFQPVAGTVRLVKAHPALTGLPAVALAGGGIYFWKWEKPKRVTNLNDPKKGWQRTLKEFNYFLTYRAGEFLLPINDYHLLEALTPLAEAKETYPSETHKLCKALKKIHTDIQEARKGIHVKWLDKLGQNSKELVENFTLLNFYARTQADNSDAYLKCQRLAWGQESVPLPDWEAPKNLLPLVRQMVLLNEKHRVKK